LSLTLENFKQTISPQILERGRRYYTRGHVVDLSLDDEAEWSAVVEGTELYDVHIVQAAGGELLAICTCPYDYGPICKHIAATLYAIEEAFPEYREGRRRKSSKPRRTRADRLRDALQAAPPAQLVDLLLELADADRDIMNRLLLRFDAVGDKPADYRQLIKDALRSPDRHGFLDYRATMQAASRVAVILNQAGDVLPAHPQRALTIYQAVFELSVVAMTQADDSSGMLGGIIEEALDGLRQCRDRLPPTDQDKLFSYVLQQTANEHVAGWNWRWDLFEIAVDLADDEPKRAALEEALEACRSEASDSKGDDWSRRYLDERIDEVRLAIIQTYDGEAAALAFMLANRHHYSFRRQLIAYYFDRGDLDTAEQLVREGLAAVEQIRAYGHVTSYREWLLVIAQRHGDMTGVIAEARKLWLGRGEAKYLELLRESIPVAEWESFREALLADEACQPHMAAHLLAADGLWLRLLELILKSPSLIGPYRNDLETRFPDEMADLYASIVTRKLAVTSDRPTYQEAVAYLQRMMLMGHAEQAEALARDFIARYPKRRAMVEELKQVLD
jgi:hypothetical protein